MRAQSLWASAVMVGFGLAVPAFAAPPSRASEEIRIGACIHASARGHLWLERTLWALRDTEGGWVGAEILNANGSFDLGPLQINSRWVTRLADITARSATSVRWWLIHDACFNVEAARWIFLSGLAKSDSYWQAVGSYHSPTDFRQRRYASDFARHLGQRFGAGVFSPLSWKR